MTKQVLRIGVGGPVGSGKTALLRALCLAMREQYQIAAVTNDIYTREDADFLIRHQALEPERILGVLLLPAPSELLRGPQRPATWR